MLDLKDYHLSFTLFHFFNLPVNWTSRRVLVSRRLNRSQRLS
jgi:hypothetical protein